MDALELWGGLECTVNRVGDAFQDQFALTGHRDRIEDLDLVAGLGLRALRYPIHWERVAPRHPDAHDWRWYDARLARLRDLDVPVIAGLVHHGSGPAYTDLLDDRFPALLAAYAGAAAARYPWIDRWTPVNEPVTTARFSALYGHWYPHRRDEGAFWRALVNQVDATRLAMRAVRRVNPAARLVQTEDLGRSFGTATMRDQVAFDNQRRWAGWDLLCGRMRPGHPLWARLAGFGLGERLAVLADDPCPPDVIGVNHYLTSDRFLDHRVAGYPADTHGGNARRRFADVAAVRVMAPGPPGLEGVLRETWARYGIPLAVTEVHNGCTREEQMRWMAEAWQTANRLRAEGVAVTAVTSWALFGGQGWNTLLTAPGLYEPGAYDVGDGTPRPTAMVALLRALAAGRGVDAVARAPGWWRRPERLLHTPVPRPAGVRAWSPPAPDAAAPVLLVGASGALGRAVAAACRLRGLGHVDVPPADVPVRAVADCRDAATLVLAGGPTPLSVSGAAPDALARAGLDLLLDGATGRWRVRGDGTAVPVAAVQGSLVTITGLP